MTALIRGGMATRREARQRQGRAMLCEGYEVNCCAVALRSTDRQGKGKALMGLAMAKRRSSELSKAAAWWSTESKSKAKEWQRKALV